MPINGFAISELIKLQRQMQEIQRNFNNPEFLSTMIELQQRAQVAQQVVNDYSVPLEMIKLQRQIQEIQRKFDEPAIHSAAKHVRGVQKAVNEPSFQRMVSTAQSVQNITSKSSFVDAVMAQRSLIELIGRNYTQAAGLHRTATIAIQVQKNFQSVVDSSLQTSGQPTGGTPSKEDTIAPSDIGIEPTYSVGLDVDWANQIAREFITSLFLSIRYAHQEYTGESVDRHRAIDLSVPELLAWGLWCATYAPSISNLGLRSVVTVLGGAFVAAAFTKVFN